MINYMLLIIYKPNKHTILVKSNNKVQLLYKNKNLNLYLTKTANTKTYHNFLNYQQFNSIYLQNIFQLNLKEKYLNALHTIPKKTTKYILFKTRFKNFKYFGIKYFNEVLYMLIVNFWLKNGQNISRFIKRKLDNVHFKKHRAYFLFFFRLIRRYIAPNFVILQIRGVTLKFKGKLGRGGNARKKTMFFWKGYYSLSNKFLALNRNKWDVWTKTGTVGCTLQIFF